MKPLRVALYSHDAMGMGHMRRNLLLCHLLSRPPIGATILLISGARESGLFPVPPGVDTLTLPALRKDKNGEYHSRSLDVSTNDLIVMRSKVIHTAVRAFCPDVFIVDFRPFGLCGELVETLEQIAREARTRCVLGLRDIVDEPAVVRKYWFNPSTEEALNRYFDALCIYGDPGVYDVAREYGLSSDLAAKMRYTGYLDQSVRCEFASPSEMELPARLGLPPGRLAVCMVGGGQDGSELAQAFAGAALPPETNAVILSGAYMSSEDEERLKRAAADNRRIRILKFVSEPGPLLRLADRVITMGGYNSVCDVLSYGKPALVVPRVKPRLEQFIRAQRLRDLGVIDMLHPADVSSEAISRWLHDDKPCRFRARERLDLDGDIRLLDLFREMVPGRAPFAVAH